MLTSRLQRLEASSRSIFFAASSPRLTRSSKSALEGPAKGSRWMRTATVRFEDLIRTTGTDPVNTIFKQRRCHIAFGRNWRGEWRSYSPIGDAAKFQYLFLQPLSGTEPFWTHQQKSVAEQSEIIPFLNSHSRDEYYRRKKNEKYRRKKNEN